jgi:DNA (cytosine-5)-methyltransferase 1
MGFDKPRESSFIIPVSDTQAYKQFGNSVVVPVFEAVATLMKPYILRAKAEVKYSRTAKTSTRKISKRWQAA